MGHYCIAHIEFADSPDQAQYEYFGRIVGFPQNYELFTMMAGVRDEGTVEQMFSARGLPERMAPQTPRGFTLRVSDVITTLNQEGYCTRAKANAYIASGSSSTWRQDRSGHLITHPDCFEPSWLTTGELLDVWIAAVGRPGNGELFGLRAVIAAMKELPNARLVFWFK